MIFKKILHYLDPRTYFSSSEAPINLKLMHGINRISILLFLFCLCVLVYKWLT